MRTAVLSVVDTPAFEWFVLVLIFASSITLCFEDIHLDANKTLKRVLYWTNFVFSLIFVIEMVLKWMALGFRKYFTSFWTILDFIIVFVSWMGLYLYYLEANVYNIFSIPPHRSRCSPCSLKRTKTCGCCDRCAHFEHFGRCERFHDGKACESW